MPTTPNTHEVSIWCIGDADTETVRNHPASIEDVGGFVRDLENPDAVITIKHGARGTVYIPVRRSRLSRSRSPETGPL